LFLLILYRYRSAKVRFFSEVCAVGRKNFASAPEKIFSRTPNIGLPGPYGRVVAAAGRFRLRPGGGEFNQ